MCGIYLRRKNNEESLYKHDTELFQYFYELM